MHALVVYESMYGNTRHVAEAIGQGLASAGTVRIVAAGDAPQEEPADYDLVVVGGPTHVHGLSRPATRHGAVEDARKPGSDQTVEPDAESDGVREWLDSLAGADGRAAAFDTRLAASPLLTGRASRTIAKKLRRAGFTLAAEPESFLVDSRTVLLPGESERAAAWGRALAAGR